MRPHPIPPKPGQESVWDYPRPPRLETTGRHIQVIFNGVVIADTRRARRVLETSHPPVYYIHPDDVQRAFLRPVTGHLSYCEFKGVAVYYDVVVHDRCAPRAAWQYQQPTAPYQALKDHLAFYAGPMEACLVDGERVTPQPGSFYGGWITQDVVGPFKGEPDSWGW